MVGKAMQMARSPDRAPEPFYALFPSDCLIKKDLKGTCFRWDKPWNWWLLAPGRRACASLACTAPACGLRCLSGSGLNMRNGACALNSVRYRHAFNQGVFDGTPEARQFSEDCAGFAFF